MTKPTNLSLTGIADWAEGYTGTPGDPPPASQNINADRLDGYHAAGIIALIPEIRTGTGTFSGNGNSATGITISPAMPNTNYAIFIMPNGALTNTQAAYIGTIWAPDSNRATGTFVVKNTGSSTATFRWMVIG